MFSSRMSSSFPTFPSTMNLALFYHLTGILTIVYVVDYSPSFPNDYLWAEVFVVWSNPSKTDLAEVPGS